LTWNKHSGAASLLFAVSPTVTAQYKINIQHDTYSSPVIIPKIVTHCFLEAISPDKRVIMKEFTNFAA